MVINLVAENFLVAGDITAGYVDVVDSTVELFRALGDALYTNEVLGGENGVGGPGLKQSNDPPPRARDVVLFSECLFYSDIQYPGTFDFSILSTVAGTGLTAGDTITIGGIVYTAIVPGAPANNQFAVATVASGSSASEALERTALNFCECVNKSTTNTTVWASYVATPGQLWGSIHLDCRTNGTAASIAVSGHGAGYRPNLTLGADFVADVFSNGFAFSKPAQGDAVPDVNVGFIGRDDTAILRQVVLRDAIYQFTDSGIYRLTGRSFEEFQSQEFDLTFRLLGREMVCVCDDYIYAWGYEGIARISGAGVEYISNSIEPLIQSTINAVGLSWVSTYSWAAAYRSRHRVLFFVPDRTNGSATNVNCPSVLVYDTRMQAWSTWKFTVGGDVDKTTGHSTGAVRVSDDLLFLGQWNNASSDSKVFKERVTYAATDYRDDTFDATNVAITKQIQWNVVVSSPELETHWDELHVLYDVSQTFSAWTTPSAVLVNFVSDISSSSGNITISPTAFSRMSRCLVSRDQRRSARLTVAITHSVAEYFGLEGLVVVHLPGEGTATVKT